MKKPPLISGGYAVTLLRLFVSVMDSVGVQSQHSVLVASSHGV